MIHNNTNIHYHSDVGLDEDNSAPDTITEEQFDVTIATSKGQTNYGNNFDDYIIIDYLPSFNEESFDYYDDCYEPYPSSPDPNGYSTPPNCHNFWGLDSSGDGRATTEKEDDVITAHMGIAMANRTWLSTDDAIVDNTSAGDDRPTVGETTTGEMTTVPDDATTVDDASSWGTSSGTTTTEVVAPERKKKDIEAKSTESTTTTERSVMTPSYDGKNIIYKGKCDDTVTFTLID